MTIKEQTDALPPDQLLLAYMHIGRTVVEDLISEEAGPANVRPALRRQAITGCHLSLFDMAVDEVAKNPPTVKHNPPPDCEYMVPVAEYKESS